MRIALIGYGKMGRLIEETAVAKGHEIVLRISTNNKEEFTKEAIQNADVAIEFTTPHAAFNNVKKCLEAGVPVVCGSTGWNENLSAIKDYCAEVNGTFLHASNFSIGVNLFFEINKHLSRLMEAQPQYNVVLKEIHHTQKLDAPSGTAVTLATQILKNISRKKIWTGTEAVNPEELFIQSERIDPAPGTHQVRYTSAIDDIEIIHTAHSRLGFAQGAVAAAEFCAVNKGVFEMRDILGL